MKYKFKQHIKVEREIEVPEFFTFLQYGTENAFCKIEDGTVYRVLRRSIGTVSEDSFFSLMSQKEVDSIKVSTPEQFRSAIKDLTCHFSTL